METIILAALVVTSLVALAFILERGLVLRRSRVIPEPVVRELETSSAGINTDSLQQLCATHPSVLGNLLQVVITSHSTWSKQDVAEAVQARARRELVKLERGLVVLEIVVGIAPLLGLVGTIYGMMTLFKGLGQNGMNDHAALAGGVAVILQSTMLGLLIAIPSLVAWSYYSKKIETLAVEMESLCGEFLNRQYSQSEK